MNSRCARWLMMLVIGLDEGWAEVVYDDNSKLPWWLWGKEAEA